MNIEHYYAIMMILHIVWFEVATFKVSRFIAAAGTFVWFLSLALERYS